MPFMRMLENLNPRELEGSPVTKGDDYTLPSKAKGAYMVKINKWKDIVIGKYNTGGVSLNRSIAEIAMDEGLNHDQLSRLIEEVNCEVYLDEYNKTKNNSVRDVKFEIATITKIKDLMNPSDAKGLETTNNDPKLKHIKGGNQGMMKKAFTESDFGEPLTFLNYTAYETYGLAPEADKDIDQDSFKLKKIAKELETLDSEIEKEAHEICDLYSDLANKFVNIGRFGNDTQAKFSTMCKEANFAENYQEAVIDMFNEKVANYKELGYIAPSMELKLEKVESLEKEKDFSLGDYSLNKAASTHVITANRAIANDVKSLVDLANSIEKRQNNLKNKQEKKAKIHTKIK